MSTTSSTTGEHHHHFVILGTGRVKCSGCGLEAPTEGPLSQCREIMMGAGGFGRCKLPLDHEGHHLEGSWEMVQ